MFGQPPQVFDIQKFKRETPYCELEVVISPEGEIYYANPSHQEFLIERAMERQGWSRAELMDACPPEYYCNFLAWLMEQSGGFIPVWEIGISYNQGITLQQKAALRKLKLSGLYRGKIPNI